MKTRSPLGALALLTVLFSASLLAQNLQLLSQVDPAQVPAGGSGDSGAPIVSADGRYVVFASTAKNLLVTSNNLPLFRGLPEIVNVFIRDRASGSISLVSVNSY